jgi:hypothetical protein
MHGWSRSFAVDQNWYAVSSGNSPSFLLVRLLLSFEVDADVVIVVVATAAATVVLLTLLADDKRDRVSKKSSSTSESK